MFVFRSYSYTDKTWLYPCVAVPSEAGLVLYFRLSEAADPTLDNASYEARTY